MTRSLGSLAAVLVFAVGSLAAQQPDLVAGTRVRVHASGATLPLTGTIAWQDRTNLAVVRSPGDTAIVPLTALTRMDVSRGRQSNVLRGARAGALIGAGAGVLLGLVAMADDDSYFDYGAEVVPFGALGGGFIGGTIGLLIGSVTTSERWTPAGTTITVRPGSSGMAIGATMTF